jgi:hypothetical protein
MPGSTARRSTSCSAQLLITVTNSSRLYAVPDGGRRLCGAVGARLPGSGLWTPNIAWVPSWKDP